jgi:hypothetical protein
MFLQSYPVKKMERQRELLLNMDTADMEGTLKRAIAAFKKIPPDEQERVLHIAAQLRALIVKKGFGFLSSIELTCALAEQQVINDRKHDTWCPCFVCMHKRRNGNE